MTRFYTALRGMRTVADAVAEEAYKARFEQAMDDDFNTPVALSVLFDLARELNKVKEADQEKAERIGGYFKIFRRFAGNFTG